MNITSAQYVNDYMDGKLIKENYCIKATIGGFECSVPINRDNRHYAAILEWVAEGNTIKEAD